MRVTELGRFDIISRRLASLRSAHQDAAREATTGQRVNAPSDDPVAAAEAARVRAGLSQAESYQRTIDLVKGDTEMAESALAEAGLVFQRAREIAMLGANEANGTDQRAALAIEANQLINQFLEIANTKGTQGFLFAGTRTSAPAFDVSGTFVGNDQEHLVQTGAGAPIAVNASGARAFTATGGIDVIQVLRDLTNSLSSDDPDAVRNTLDQLQSAHDQIARERSHAGLIINRLELSESILTQRDVDLSQRDRDMIGTDTDKVLLSARSTRGRDQ
ncbi:MAG: flagellar hook-associated protein FlgL [Polyangiaceae bacterium]